MVAATAMRTSNETSPISKWKTTNFARAALFSLKTCKNPTLNSLLWHCLGGRRHKNQFNFFSETDLGCGPQDSVRKFTYICHFKTVGINAKKLKKKQKKNKGNKERKKTERKSTFILIARDVFVALAVQTRMIKWGKVSDRLDKFSTLQNIANLQGIGFTLDFGFKIYRDLTKLATFEFGFTCCICLNQGSFLFSVGWEGRGRQAIWRIGLPLKKISWLPPWFLSYFLQH